MNNPIVDPIVIDGRLTAQISFFVFFLLLLAFLMVLAKQEMKLLKHQAKEVDKYMAGVVANQLLHSPEDYKKASLLKSKYLLFKRTWIPFTFLIFSSIIFLAYVGGAFGFKMDTVTSIEEINEMTGNICHWGSGTWLGKDPIFIDTGWGFDFFAGFRGSRPFDGLMFYIVYTNITTLGAVGWIYIQLQGFAVRYLYTSKVCETSWNYQASGAPRD